MLWLWEEVYLDLFYLQKLIDNEYFLCFHFIFWPSILFIVS